jgi:predicted Zn-dependent peptidase
MKFFTLAILLSVSFFSNAQLYEERKDSSKGYVYTYFEGDPTKSRKYTLKNGLTVIMSVNIDKPRIYTCIAVKAGSNNDPKKNTGLAHYLEHMLFKGTDRFGTSNYEKEKIYLDQIDNLYAKYNKAKDEKTRAKIYQQIDSVSAIAAEYSIANEYDKMLLNIGAQGTNAFTSFEETVYINDIPASQIDTWLEIEAERFRNPVLRLFHTELEAVYEEKNISLDNDREKVTEALYADLFRNHNYGLQTTIGKIEHLKNPSLVKIREYYYQNYVPNNMAIILSGYFDPEETLAKIEKNFGYMVPKELKKLKFSPEKSRDTIIPIEVFGEQSEFVSIGYRLPGIQAADNYKSVLLKEILDNSVAGLIDLNINKKLLVQKAWASLEQNKDNNVLVISGIPKKNQTLEEVKNILLAQIDSLKMGKFDGKLIAAAGFNQQVNNDVAFADITNTAFYLLNSFTREIPFRKQLLEPIQMMKTSKKELEIYAMLQLKKNYSIVYKRQGKDTSSAKILKPNINPVSLNNDKMSRFAKNIIDNEIPEEKPVFIDFDKDIIKDSISSNCKILYTPNKKNRLFTLNYVFEFGRYADQKLPIAFELLKLSGTENQSSSSIAKEFYNLACTFDVSVENEQMYMQLIGPDSTFERALSTLDYLISNLKAEDKVLDELVSNILKQREDSKFNKNAIKRALFNYVCFGEENPSTIQISNKELAKLRAKDMEEQIHEIFAFDHKVLYYGPRDIKTIKALILKHHTIPEKVKTSPANRIFNPIQYTEPQVYFTNFEMVQAEINWHSQGTIYNPNNEALIGVFNEYYGSGMASVFFQTIRESKALAYSTFANYIKPTNLNTNGRFVAYVGTQADKLDSAIISVNSLINDMPISDALFENAKKSKISLIASERILNGDILFYYLDSKRLNNNYDIRKDIYIKTKQLNLSEMQTFQYEEIKSKKQAISIVGSKDKIDIEKLNKYGKVKVLTQKEIFNY